VTLNGNYILSHLRVVQKELIFSVDLHYAQTNLSSLQMIKTLTA